MTDPGSHSRRAAALVEQLEHLRKGHQRRDSNPAEIARQAQFLLEEHHDLFLADAATVVPDDDPRSSSSFSISSSLSFERLLEQQRNGGSSESLAPPCTPSRSSALFGDDALVAIATSVAKFGHRGRPIPIALQQCFTRYLRGRNPRVATCTAILDAAVTSVASVLAAPAPLNGSPPVMAAVRPPAAASIVASALGAAAPPAISSHRNVDPLLQLAYTTTMSLSRLQHASCPPATYISLLQGSSVLYTPNHASPMPPHVGVGSRSVLPIKHKTLLEAKTQRCPDAREILQRARNAAHRMSPVDLHRVVRTLAEEGFYDYSLTDHCAAAIGRGVSVLPARVTARTVHACGILGHRNAEILAAPRALSPAHLDAPDALYLVQGMAMLQVATVTAGTKKAIVDRLWTHAMNPSTPTSWHVDVHHALAVLGWGEFKLILHSCRTLRCKIHTLSPMQTTKLMYAIGPITLEMVPAELRENWHVKVDKFRESLLMFSKRTWSAWSMTEQAAFRSALLCSSVTQHPAFEGSPLQQQKHGGHDTAGAHDTSASTRCYGSPTAAAAAPPGGRQRHPYGRPGVADDASQRRPSPLRRPAPQDLHHNGRDDDDDDVVTF